MTYAERTGVRKISCTLAPPLGEVCPSIVGATMLAVPVF
jgi:hypothetical protein